MQPDSNNENPDGQTDKQTDKRKSRKIRNIKRRSARKVEQKGWTGPVAQYCVN